MLIPHSAERAAPGAMRPGITFELKYSLLASWYVIRHHIGSRDLEKFLHLFHSGGEMRSSLPPRGCIWFHAAAAGEVVAAHPVMAEVRRRCPGVPFLLTTSSYQGREMATRRGVPAHVAYRPVDLPGFVGTCVRRLQPKLLVIVENELLPNLLHALGRQFVPVVWLNARMVDWKDTSRHAAWVRQYFEHMLSLYDVIGAKTEEDRARLLALRVAPERVHVAGDVKLDALPEPVATSASEACRDRARIPSSARLIVAGGILEGEQDILLQAYESVRARVAGAVLVIAPTDIRLAKSMKERALTRGLRAWCLTDPPLDSPEVLIVDTIGDLTTFYALADVAIVGATLLPHSPGRGVWEPVNQGKRVVYGEFQDTTAELRELEDQGIAFRAQGTESLAAIVERLFEEDGAADCVVKMAKAAIDCRKGAAARGASLICDLLL